MKRKQRSPTVNFAAQDFRKVHGFMPRGIAYWTFYFSDMPDSPWRASPDLIGYLGAKQLAVIEARKRNVTAVRVDPNPERFTLYDSRS